MLEAIFSIITVQDLIWLIIAVPFLGFVVNGIISLVTINYGTSEPRTMSVLIGVLSPLFSFIGIILVGYLLINLKGTTPSVITGSILEWNGFMDQTISFGLKFDQLALAISFVIAFVGFGVHVYSVGYFSREKRVAPYFAVLNLLFALALLMVLTDSLFFFFVAWQMIGIAGLLTVNRFFNDSVRAGNANRLYVVESFSASAFVLVMVLIWRSSLGHEGVDLDIFKFSTIQFASFAMMDNAAVICSALFIAIVIRSIQFPLYVWINSSKEAPFPVFGFLYIISYLLIAAYLLIRLNFILILAPKFLFIIAIFGACAALISSLSQISQKDFRSLIGYFAISQAGFVMMAVGVGAFSSAVFHMFTYGIYTAVLIFGMGAVAYVTGSFELESVAGLRRYMPVTFWTTVSGLFAACSIYPFSGFFGRGRILWELYQRGHFGLFFLALISSILITISLFRMTGLVFLGRPDREELKKFGVQESSVSMLVVMVVFAFTAFVSGIFGVSEAFGGKDAFGSWLMPGLAVQMIHVAGDVGMFSELALGVVMTLLLIHSGMITWIVYSYKRKWAGSIANRYRVCTNVLREGFYFEKIWASLFGGWLNKFSEIFLDKGLNKLIVEGVIIGGFGRIADLGGEIISKITLERAPSYILLFVAVLIMFLCWVIF